MAETGGLMLLRAGLLTQEQLAQANLARREHGGTLGAHLIALGLLAEDQLADFYRHRLMVPRIGRDALQSVAKKIIDIVPPDMAAEFRVVPVSVDREGNLTLAMADPSDTHAVDEVGFFTGHFVMRAVATESTIEWALDKYYGIATQAIPGAATPAPAAPVAATPVAARAPTATGATAAISGAFVAAVTTTAVIAPATPLEPAPDEGEVVLLTTPKAPARAAPAPPPEAPAAPAVVIVTEPAITAPAATPPGDEGVTLVHAELSTSGRIAGWTTADAPPESPAAAALTQAIHALREAGTLEGVAHALLDYFGSFCARAAFFTVRKGHLRCEQTRGVFLTPELHAYNASVEDPSVFRDVIVTRFPYRGSMGDSQVARDLLVGLPAPGGEDVVLVPIAVRHRVVSIAYGDRLTGDPSEAGMTRVALEAGIAYERLIASRKEASSKTGA